MASKFYLSPAQKIVPLAFILILLAVLGYFYLFSKGTLEIQSNPEDVSVFVNGTSTSKKTKLKPGTYTVKVAKDGYVAFFREIKITVGSNKKIAPFLKKLPETKQIASNVNYITRFNDNVYYISDNILYKKSGGIEQKITSNKFSNTSKIIFLPDEQNCLVQKGDQLFFYEFRRYDLINQVETQILSQIGDFALTPDGTKIAYTYYPVGGEKLIQLSNNNGTESRIVFNLKNINFSNPSLLFTPDGSKLLIAEKDLYLLDLSNGQIKKIAENVTRISPSPENQMILAADKDNNLKIIKFDGELVYNLTTKTSIDKTSWISKSNKLIFYLDNGFYLVDLTDSKMIPFQTIKIEGVDRILSAENNKAYFMKNNNLYEIETITGWE